jgi:hypothetical protein
VDGKEINFAAWDEIMVKILPVTEIKQISASAQMITEALI